MIFLALLTEIREVATIFESDLPLKILTSLWNVILYICMLPLGRLVMVLLDEYPSKAGGLLKNLSWIIPR